MLSLGGHLLEVVAYILDLKFASLAYGNWRDGIEYSSNSMWKSQIQENYPVLPIEIFQSVVIPRNAMLQHSLL